MTRRSLLAFLLWLSLAGPAVAAPGLDELLTWQRASWPGALVTSGFHDWRTVSRYRSVAGLHAGYDIAMPAGARALAAWPGRVVAVTPWWGSEWGVTVLHQDGWEATYGHLVPSVQVGDPVQAGDPVGTVAVDHLDVKVRDPQGRYVDFGNGFLALSGPATPSAPPALARWRRLEQRVVRALQGSASSPSGRSVEEETRMLALRREGGLISENEARRLEADLERARAAGVPEPPRGEDLPTAAEVRAARKQAEEALGAAGSEDLGGGPTGLRARELLARSLAAQREKLARLERLDEVGAAPPRELEGTRARLRHLEALWEGLRPGAHR